MEKRSPNDLSAAVPKFCLALEEFRRTSDGRVRTSQEFLQHFFPHDQAKSTDRIFKYLPNEVRGPVLTQWGLRGAKSALKDTDEKVQSVVWDALLAGDMDHEAFEGALVPDMMIRWAPLPDWWAFWRGGRMTKIAIHKVLDTGYELALFDAKWFFEVIEGPGGKLKGTDVVSEGLTKAELTEWIRKIHASGDGSPKGMLAAIGWDRVVGKTPNDVLLKVIDLFAQKILLVEAKEPPAAGASAAPAASFEGVDERPSERITPVPPGPELRASAHPADQEDSTIARGSIPAAARARSVPPELPKSALTSPDDKAVDDLFNDAILPASEELVVVDDEIDMSNVASDRPPPPAENEPMLLKARAPSPGSVTKVPSARRG